MLKYKKSEAGLVVVFVVIVILFFLGWLINFSQRECKSNKDCGSESYCGSDFACHQYPNIQKTIIQYNFFWPALILGIAIVAAAMIFRWKKNNEDAPKPIAQEAPLYNNQTNSKEESSEDTKLYYKSNIKTP